MVSSKSRKSGGGASKKSGGKASKKSTGGASKGTKSTKSSKKSTKSSKKGDALKLGKRSVKSLSGRAAARGGTRTQGRDIFAPPGTETNCTCTCKPYSV